MPRSPAVALLLWSAAGAALAQDPPAAPSPPAGSVPAPAQSQRIEITGGRASDTEERRQSTAAKIVIGREEIEKFGDTNLGEVLRRLPGVTTPGPAGRGGPPRLRGLGGGYTQLLIDGQRVPPGFSLEAISPEQIERIEILRAPTAETGARAIAGTINVVTRGGFKRRLNDLRIGAGVENGQPGGGVFWTHNDSRGPLTYNLTASLFSRQGRSESTTETVTDDLAAGTHTDRTERSTTDDQRTGLNLNGRLQWALGAAGDALVLQPSLFTNGAQTARRFDLLQTGDGTPPYDHGTASGDSRFTNLRVNGQWRRRLGDSLRMELQGWVGRWQSDSDSTRFEYADGQDTPLRRLDDRASARENALNLTLKLTQLAGGDADGTGAHSLVGGAEVEALRRHETRTTLQDGQPLLPEFGDNLSASSTRLALYGQDEWSLDRHWSVHAGARWEGIETVGDTAVAGADEHPRNRSSVFTPLIHLLWKPDPARRDQLRLSLTRSYRSPALGVLIARPVINSQYPPDGPNVPTAPDRTGNPDLRPELATGVDLAFERYLEGGGLLSANLFHRRITDLMRSVTTLQDVSWSPVPRWVAQQQNIGGAWTQGLELEARFRLDQWLAEAPPVELRGNLSFYRSNVDGVPGPDNRLADQAPATGNLGADYRLRGWPLSLGGNFNWVPGYRTQLSESQTTSVNSKRQFDAYALWTFTPATAMRLMANNLAPQEHVATNAQVFPTLRETATTTAPTHTQWQLRLELKL
jgi:iron complex outermembrane receptor protein